MRRKLSRSVLKKAQQLNTGLADAVAAVPEATLKGVTESVGAGRVNELKEMGREVFSAVVPTDERGQPANPVDRAHVKIARDNADYIRSEVARILKKRGGASSNDYYGIYYKVLADSGAPPMVRAEWVREAKLLPETGHCAVCLECTVCGACGLCTFTFIEAFVAAGIAGTTVGVFI